jgi:hypothetical protein
MMKKLNLNEGDPVRLNGTTLPKGKLVKIQAQSTDFLEVSDPKAVYVLCFVLGYTCAWVTRRRRACWTWLFILALLIHASCTLREF